VNEGVGCLTCGSDNVEAGVKLRPKDLRDYFASTVQTEDPRVLMSLMRHTNLTTTTKYIQAVRERMREAVRGFGIPAPILDATLDATQNSLPRYKTVQVCNSRIPEKMIPYVVNEENGERIN